ncbi:MAG: folylpolyglutamate synthase/dihydrofolate synthase family protein [Clostridiaceae bacterium]|nr:folylpolyglutamate synthase/dihydrofolate synthase family protein [Clostridiaceae bacterium]
MTYEEALSFIHGATRTGARDGFGRITRALEIIGNPQKRLKFVHVAGTNGKGSTATMTANVLTAAGFKTGLFISPYVVDFRERIQLDGQFIPKADLAAVVDELMPVFEQVKREVAECTEFETVTVIALYWYAKMGCDFVVLEAGIGGLHDKTNVIDPPMVSVITSISFDHMKILGNTLAEIAGQKSGIIKSGSSVALYCDLPKEALDVLLERCREVGTMPNIPDLEKLEILSIGAEGSDIRYKGLEYHIPLIGRHQIYNTLTVIAVCEELIRQGVHIDYRNVYNGISGTHFVGRCEILLKKPLFIIDGAHNIDGARSICRVMDEVMAGRKITAIMGMLEDKAYHEAIEMVSSRAARFIAVTPDSYRCLPAEKAAEVAKSFCDNITVIPKPAEAALYALETASEDEVIIACGSLYMIGEIKECLLSSATKAAKK